MYLNLLNTTQASTYLISSSQPDYAYIATDSSLPVVSIAQIRFVLPKEIPPRHDGSCMLPFEMAFSAKKELNMVL